MPVEFEVADLVLINLKSLRILANEEGLGKKLNSRFDGPFEIIENISPVAYRMHNVVNIAHLELYANSPEEFGDRSIKKKQRIDSAADEWEIDMIVAEKVRKNGARQVPFYRVRYTGYGPEHDEWIPKHWLRNAPEIMKRWEQSRKETT